jgi:hypothetical protein
LKVQTLFDLASKHNQQLIIQIVSILKNSMQIQPNYIEFQTLELPRILIKILARILESSNKENCSLFNFRQNHILIEIFRIQEVHLLIESSHFLLKFF